MNPCIKTGITVETDDGKFIHGDLFLNQFGVQIRGAREMMDKAQRPVEAIVAVNESSTRDGYIDYNVDVLEIMPSLKENIEKWSPEAVKYFIYLGAWS